MAERTAKEREESTKRALESMKVRCTVQYSSVQDSTVQYCECHTVQCLLRAGIHEGTAYRAVQYSTVNAMLCSDCCELESMKVRHTVQCSD